MLITVLITRAHVIFHCCLDHSVTLRAQRWKNSFTATRMEWLGELCPGMCLRVCVVYPCFCIWQTYHSINSTLRFSLDLFVLVCPVNMRVLCLHVYVPSHRCMSVSTQLGRLRVHLCACLHAHLLLCLCLCNRLTQWLHVNLLLCVMCYIRLFLFRQCSGEQSGQLLSRCKHKHVYCCTYMLSPIHDCHRAASDKGPTGNF